MDTRLDGAAGGSTQMKRLSMNERRQMFLSQHEAERDMRARLLAPVPTGAPAPSETRRRTWVIVTLLASLLVSGGLALGHVVTFHVPLSIVDAVWPKL